MTKKKLVKLELTNPRYSRAELKDHASEFIHYARYAGYVLKDFNMHLSASKLHPVKPEISERNHRLSIETTIENAKMLSQIIRIYPSFSNWRLKMISPFAERSASKPAKTKPKKTVKKKVKKPAGKTTKKPKAKKPKKSGKTTAGKPAKTKTTSKVSKGKAAKKAKKAGRRR
jgi:hypothetical protein